MNTYILFLLTKWNDNIENIINEHIKIYILIFKCFVWGYTCLKFSFYHPKSNNLKLNVLSSNDL